MPVRFAILGFGHHAEKRLVGAFARSAETVLTGIWRRDQAAAQQNCREHNFAHCFRSREELCASSEIDAVFITSPDAMHHDDALLAFAGGKAVLCEKPLAMSAAEAEQMATAADRAGVQFGVAQNFRWNRSLQWAREQIASGRLGMPQIAHAQFAYQAERSPRRWITDPALACGGPIGDVGVHCIDALRFVLGQEVTAIETLSHADALSGAVEAFASMQMEMSGGCLALTTVSARAAYRTLIEITGSKASLVIETGLTVDRPIEGLILDGTGVVERQGFNNHDAYTLMLDSFARAMHGEEDFAATGRDGVRNMQILDAAYGSARAGSRLERLSL